MSKNSIMKELDSEMLTLTADDFHQTFSRKKNRGGFLKHCLLIISVILLAGVCFMFTNLKVTNIAAEETITAGIAPMAATAEKKDVISIPTGIVKANPFVPYRNLGNENGPKDLINDVPKFDLISPPEELAVDSEASRVMDTVVSGILYDKYSPSAILNIDGTDYLVKKGDTINNYKVIAIAQNSVTVKLGSNTYTAGIGELLTESAVNYNNVSNLSKKFGGEKR